jgi:hypothetical protein
VEIGLFYIEYESFEILAFGVVYVHRMIGRLGKLVKDADTAPRLRCGAEHCEAELLFIDCLRA